MGCWGQVLVWESGTVILCCSWTCRAMKWHMNPRQLLWQCIGKRRGEVFWILKKYFFLIHAEIPFPCVELETAAIPPDAEEAGRQQCLLQIRLIKYWLVGMEPDLLGCHSKHSSWGAAAACLGLLRGATRTIPDRLGLTPAPSAAKLLTPCSRLCWMQHRSMDVWSCPIPGSVHFKTLLEKWPHNWTREYSRRNFSSPLYSRLQVCWNTC